MNGAFFYVTLTALAFSVANYAMSMTLRKKAVIGGYLSTYFLISFGAALLLNQLVTFKHPFSIPMASLGSLSGIIMIALMIGIGRTLQLGPSGLTFAFLNAGSIIPPLLMSFLFGAAFGFSLSFANIVGMAITLVGLFWAARQGLKDNLTLKWVLFALFIFLFQGILLADFQWRCLLITEDLLPHLLIPFHCTPEEDLWFMPALFLAAFILQFLYFSFSEKRMPNGVEWLGGLVGGIANALGIFFVLRATWVATANEKVMLFPLLAVMVILICNILGRILYREKINWVASFILVLGIFIGTLL